jgi:hypothetical protein
MGKPKEIIFPKDHESSGIQISYIKSRDVLYISGFYDHFVGIEGTEIKFTDFCYQLGINVNRAITPWEKLHK